MMKAPLFSGSYDRADVTLLLNMIDEQAATSLYVEPQAKEYLIQRGKRHYSEMISPERAPSAEYMAIFETALARHGARMGREVASLVVGLAARIDGPLTLCSLVRAGLPLGVLLQRGLHFLGRDSQHFGISIIRDRGIDTVAMAHLLKQRPVAGFVFVDGWTGKGAIADELATTIQDWPELEPRLVVLADPAGRAWLSASNEDWLIPSGILGSTASGLISRSILNESVSPKGSLHAAIHLSSLEQHDVSRLFVDVIWAEMLNHLRDGANPPATPKCGIQSQAQQVIHAIAEHYDIVNRNRIKPGIAEATRAVLRRAPELILVAGGSDPDLDGLRYLAQQSQVAIVAPNMLLHPYRAVTVIKKSK